MNVTPRYKAPPMPWGITVDDLPGFLRSIGRAYGDGRTDLPRKEIRARPVRRAY